MPIDRSPRDDITAEQRATAVANVLSGAETERAAARRLGVSHFTVQRWREHYLASLAPPQPPLPTALDFDPGDVPIGDDNGADRSDARLQRLIFDAVTAQLQAITNRARITGRASWIERQPADHLAHVDTVAWGEVVRLVQTLALIAQQQYGVIELPAHNGRAAVDAAD